MRVSLRPLLLRTQLMDGESLSSLLSRLATLNHYDSPRVLYQLCLSNHDHTPGYYYHLSHIDDVDVYKRLSNLTCIGIDDLYSASSHAFAQVLAESATSGAGIELRTGVSVPVLGVGAVKNHLWSDRAAQYCPACLKESGYHRRLWSLVSCAVCLRHLCLLEQACPTCCRHVGVADVVANKCFRCNADLSRTPLRSIAADSFGVFAQGLIQYWLAGHGTYSSYECNVPDQPAAVLYRLVDGLRRIIMRLDPSWAYLHSPPAISEPVSAQSTGKKKEIDTFGRFVSYTTAVKALVDWPQGFYEFLNAYSRRAGRRLTGTIKHDFGVVYDPWLTKLWQVPPFAFLHDAFDGYLHSQYPVALSALKGSRFRDSPESAKRSEYMPIGEAAGVLRVAAESVEHLMKSGVIGQYRAPDGQLAGLVRRSDVLGLRQKWSSAVGLRTASKMLGVNKDHLAEQARRGLLPAERTPGVLGSNGWKFQREIILALRDTVILHLRAHTSSHTSMESRLAEDPSEWNHESSSVEPCAFASTVIVFVRGGQEIPTDGTYMREADVRGLIETLKREMGWVSWSEVRQLLHKNTSTLRRWTDSGWLNPVIEFGSVRYYDRAEVENFYLRFIDCGAAAILLGISVRAVNSLARHPSFEGIIALGVSDASRTRYRFCLHYLQAWQQEHLTVTSAREYLCLSRSTFYRLLNTGELSIAVDVGQGHKWIARREIEGFLLLHPSHLPPDRSAEWRKEWLTPDQASEILGVVPATLSRWVSEGKLVPRQEPRSKARWFARADINALAGRGHD